MYEKQLIAAMNNFEAAQAWRAADREGLWRSRYYHRLRHANLIIDRMESDRDAALSQIRVLQKELCASREENRAIREELGDVYEMYTSRMLTLYRLEEKNYWLQLRVQSATEVELGTWGLCGVGLWAQVLLILP